MGESSVRVRAYFVGRFYVEELDGFMCDHGCTEEWYCSESHHELKAGDWVGEDEFHQNRPCDLTAIVHGKGALLFETKEQAAAHLDESPLRPPFGTSRVCTIESTL